MHLTHDDLFQIYLFFAYMSCVTLLSCAIKAGTHNLANYTDKLINLVIVHQSHSPQGKV